MLTPKFEYVISIRLSDIQLNMYQFYLDNRQDIPTRKPKSGGISLFNDWNIFQMISNHPWLLQLSRDRQRKVRPSLLISINLLPVDSNSFEVQFQLDDFLDDESSESEETSESTSSSSRSSSSGKASDDSDVEILEAKDAVRYVVSIATLSVSDVKSFQNGFRFCRLQGKV